MKIISSSIKERLLMRRCMIIFNKNNVLAIEYEITGDDQLPLLILIVLYLIFLFIVDLSIIITEYYCSTSFYY